MNATLLVIRADGESQEIVLRQDRVVVGRDKSAHLRVPSRSVSRQHCEFVSEDGSIVVRDLESSNGTFVNRERVQEAELSAGDLVSVGPAVFVLRIDGQPEGLDPADVHSRGSVDMAEDQPAQPSYPGGNAAAAAALAGGDKPRDADDSDLAMDALSDNADDSSVLDFDFDLGDDDDEDEDQPSL